jgi:TonB family protein
MRVRGLVGQVVLGWVLSVSLVAAHGQQSDVMNWMTKAAAQADLDQVDAKPWHLKLDVTLFNAQGANPVAGTIEVWHSGPDERITFAFGAVSATKLRSGGKTYWNSTGTIPDGAEEILAEVLHIGPSLGDVSESAPELRKEKFGKTQLDCIMLTPTMKGKNKVPVGLFPTYCLDPSGDEIRISYEFGSKSVVANQLGKFLDHEVPMQLAVNEGKVLVATSKVSALATYSPSPEEFTPGPEMKQASDIARISGGMMVGSRLTFVQPAYPQEAKMDHRSGTVILRAIIGRDGHIRSLRPMNGDWDFIVAAIAAVQQWTYKPYSLNGEPVDVETTITVNSALSPN